MSGSAGRWVGRSVGRWVGGSVCRCVGVSVGSYLIGGLPLIYIAAQEVGLVNHRADAEHKMKVHAKCVALFLVFGHIAMIAGMLDPSLLSGGSGTEQTMPMSHSH